ncbi:MAG: hypothetical protein LC122_12925 [Chitinophagales bacterium]|nr:hypothetical protein [Chitinophagales bacterium]
MANKQKTYAETIATLLKDKWVEIYLGEKYEEVQLEQIKKEYPSVICGKIIDGVGDVLIVSCMALSNNKKNLHKNKKVYINAFSIKLITELIDGSGTSTIFVSTNEALDIVNKFGDK